MEEVDYLCGALRIRVASVLAITNEQSRLGLWPEAVARRKQFVIESEEGEPGDGYYC